MNKQEKLDKKHKEKVKKAKDAVLDMMPWGKTPQGVMYWSDVIDSFDKILEQLKTKKKPEERGYFDGVTTWSEAIELLTKANEGHNWLGHFEDIGGEMYFRLAMNNDKSSIFNRGKPLLSKTQGEDEDDKRTCGCCDRDEDD